jgi:hypothetical protein
MERAIAYFERKGKVNTAETLRIARERATELGIRRAVVASTHGGTALQAATAFHAADIEVIAVSISAAFDDMGWTLGPDERRRLEENGVKVLTSVHALGDGIPEGLQGEATTGNVVCSTLRWFSQGMKVAVEVALMAVEAGLVNAGEECVAIGGTDEGADTAIVIRPAFARKAKDIRICEILCKPRLA